jgi:hypothetical protein
VLRETGKTWTPTVKFKVVVSDAQKTLGLMVGTLAPDKAGDDSLKKVLDGLYKVAIGIGELLRNRYGRDHGRRARCAGLLAGMRAWPCTVGRLTAGSCSTPSPTRPPRGARRTAWRVMVQELRRRERR